MKYFCVDLQEGTNFEELNIATVLLGYEMDMAI
jgi:hypothetical protein